MCQIEDIISIKSISWLSFGMYLRVKVLVAVYLHKIALFNYKQILPGQSTNFIIKMEEGRQGNN